MVTDNTGIRTQITAVQVLVVLVRSTLHILISTYAFVCILYLEYFMPCHFSTRPSSAGSTGSKSRKTFNEDAYVGSIN